MAITLEELFEKLPGAFNPDKAQGLDVVIQFNLSGEEASDWYVIVKDGTCEVGKGQHEAPTSPRGARASARTAVVTGRLDAMAAFMQQKVTLQGDLNLAMKFAQIFKFSK